MKAYGIDCILAPFLFCLTGYFSGIGKTGFVMAQGIIGAFLARIPFAWLMSRLDSTTMFHIGLGTPVATVVQLLLCAAMLCYLRKNMQKNIKL